MTLKAPEGKYMGTVKVGEKGQIVIPKQARDMFAIQPGDTLLLMADIDRGIAIVGHREYLKFAQAVFSARDAAENGEE